MKMIALIVLLLIGISESDLIQDTGEVYFLRDTGNDGSAWAFRVFVDDDLICKLNNKRFSTHNISAGEHYFYVQYSGNNPKKDADRIKVNIEPGKTYYIELIQKKRAFTENIFCQEVTENSAKILLPRLKEDKKCL
jgi:hypothetical protein